MEKAGVILRAARQEKGISLREVEEATKIRLRYLDALEKGEYDQLPGRVYAIGFVRNYARYLGLDERALIQQFKQEYPADEDNYQVAETSLAPAGLATGKWRRWLLILVVLVVLGGINWLYNYRQPSLNQPPPSPPPANEPAPVNPPPAAQPPPATPPPRAEGVEVRVKASGDCWVGVTIDGKSDFNGTLQFGADRVFQGKEKVTITLGSAGNVEVTVNGQVQPALGRVGEVVTFEAAKDASQVKIIKKS